MISTFPLPTCPVCDYSLAGHPKGGRCPECGFEWDEYTVVFRPSRKWKAYVGVGLLAVVLCWHLIPSAYYWGQAQGSQFLTIAMPCLMVLGSVGAILLLTWLRPRRPCVIAVTAAGLLIRHRYKQRTIPYSNLGLIALFDMPPAIKTRNEEETIAVRGFFDNKHEKRVFRQVVGLIRSRTSAPEETSSKLADRGNSEAIPADIAELQALATPLPPLKRGAWFRLLLCGISLWILVSVGRCIVDSIWTKAQPPPAVRTLLALGSIAIVVTLLAASWKSDERPRQ